MVINSTQKNMPDNFKRKIPTPSHNPEENLQQFLYLPDLLSV
jgi:hypothetical protein